MEYSCFTDRSAKRARWGRFFRAFAYSLTLVFATTMAWAAAPTPSLTLRVPSNPAPQPSMSFVLVHAENSACDPHCPRWISAEGKIEIGTAAIFARFVASLGNARPPILISSSGGSVADAMAMGRLIRSKHLAVVVAHTTITPCAPMKGKPCESTGAPAARAGYCASACGLVLAGGVERYVIPNGAVGVHQMIIKVAHTRIFRTYMVHYRVVNGRREEVSRDLTSEKRDTTTSTQGPTPKLESDVGAYLNEMGVDGLMLKLMDATPASSLHWMTNSELIITSLATMWIDTATVMEFSGANGRAGPPVSSRTPRRAMARGLDFTLLPPPKNGPPTGLESDFAYRRGGGVVGHGGRTRIPSSHRRPGPPGASVSVRGGQRGALPRRETQKCARLFGICSTHAVLR